MRKIALADGELQPLFGVHDENLQHLETVLDIKVSARDREVFLEGEEPRIEIAEKVLTELGRLISRGYSLQEDDFRIAVRMAKDSPGISLERFFTDPGIQTARDRLVRAQGTNQRLYVEAIRTHDIVFAIGPAGTGKTYLAMAMAIETLNRRAARRIILARPALEAGEKLGFLPGDMFEKVNPYLRPLYDALYELVGVDRANRLIERGHIEIAPIAFMRGRTLSDSVVILDEAQNTTAEQMKMFLTRIGMNSRAVITGDVTQIDLPNGRISGLVEASRLLRGIRGISFVQFDQRDVVRHPLVQEIISAYERDGEMKRSAKEAAKRLVPTEGVATDGVAAEGVPAEGVAAEVVPAEGGSDVAESGGDRGEAGDE